jgi:hypothetical protein
MTYDFKKGQNESTITKGEWILSLVGDRKSALLCCPKCGRFGSLAGHEIDKDGIVTPSVLHEYPIADLDGSNPREGCGFHEMIRLLDWAT